MRGISPVPVETAIAVYRTYIDAENGRDRQAMEACLSTDLVVSVNGVVQLADRQADADATDRLLARYPTYERTVVGVGAHTTSDVTVVSAEWTMSGSASDPTIPDLELSGCTIAEVTWDGGSAKISGARLYTDAAKLAELL